MGVILFNKNKLEELLVELDKELKTPANLYVIGGAAATMVYGSKKGTKDIDTWNREKAIDEAHRSVVSKNPGLNIPLGPAGVHIKSEAMLARFMEYTDLNLKKLKIFIPDADDFILLKAQRADEKDILDINDLVKLTLPNKKNLFNRFTKEILPLNYGSDDILIENYLMVIEEIFGIDEAITQEKKLKP